MVLLFIDIISRSVCF